MENLPSLLESIYTTWLSLSSTIWAMDMILAFVCGLGLYLLLLPFLESHLSSSPSNIKFTRKVRNSQLNLTGFSLSLPLLSFSPPSYPSCLCISFFVFKLANEELVWIIGSSNKVCFPWLSDIFHPLPLLLSSPCTPPLPQASFWFSYHMHLFTHFSCLNTTFHYKFPFFQIKYTDRWLGRNLQKEQKSILLGAGGVGLRGVTIASIWSSQCLWGVPWFHV